jgi:hypothetical protein
LSIIATGVSYAQEAMDIKTTITTIYGDRINGYIKLQTIPSILAVYYGKEDSLIVNSNLIQSISFKKIKNQALTSGSGINTGPEKLILKYFNNTLVGVLSGKSTDDSQPGASLSAETINGIIIYHFLSTGIGVAYDQFNTTATLPFFISLRGDIMRQSFTPFYFVDAGYGAAWDSRENDANWNNLDVEGGFMLHSGIGYKMYSDDRINVMIALGYKLQKTVYNTLDWSGGTLVTDRTYKRLSFRLGIGF